MKKAIVIGASSGIGKELAKLLAADGYETAITGRRDELLAQLAHDTPNCHPIALDIANALELPQRLNEILRLLKRIDLFVLSSGTGTLNPGLDFAPERETIETNVTGFTCCLDWAYTTFKKQGYGHLVAITSIAALRGNRQAPAYNASKAYQANYLEGIRQKAVKERLKLWVTDIRPGFVDTAMAKGEGKFWVMPVAVVAEQINRAIQRKKAIAYVTRRWRLIAWILKVLPTGLYSRL